MLEDENGIVSELEGVSPAFIRELLRRAALLGDASDPDDDDVEDDED